MLAHLALVLLLLVHGLIHALGFVKAFGLAEVAQLSGATLFALPASLARVVGALWLVACLGFVAAAVALLVRGSAWWPIAAASVVLSQLLLVYAWPDAKAGTLANVLVALAVLVAWADARFERDTRAAVQALYAGMPSGAAAKVADADLAALPEPVQRWLRRSGVVGRPQVRSVRLAQRGTMRTTPAGAGMPTVAQQAFRIDQPGFVWDARVRMLGVLPLAGRDSYLGGKGHMEIQALALFPVVDAVGPQIDQGTLLRFLGEMMWFPSAALHPALRWEPIDAGHARVTMSYGGLSADATFGFDAEGRTHELSAERYMSEGGSATLRPWLVRCREWTRMNGFEIPTRGSVLWKLPSGDFDYFSWEIVAIEHDPSEPAAPRPLDAE